MALHTYTCSRICCFIEKGGRKPAERTSLLTGFSNELVNYLRHELYGPSTAVPIAVKHLPSDPGLVVRADSMLTGGSIDRILVRRKLRSVYIVRGELLLYTGPGVYKCCLILLQILSWCQEYYMYA